MIDVSIPGANLSGANLIRANLSGALPESFVKFGEAGFGNRQTLDQAAPPDLGAEIGIARHDIADACVLWQHVQRVFAARAGRAA